MGYVSFLLPMAQSFVRPDTPVVLSSLGPIRPPTHSVAARMHKAPAGCRIVSELCAHAACTEYIYRACPSPSYEGAWLRWRLVARTAIIVKLCKVMPSITAGNGRR